MRANDAISGAVLIVLSLAMIAYTFTFPAFPGQRFGPSLFPRLLGGGLIICGSLLMWRGLKEHAGKTPWLTVSPLLREPWRLVSFLLVIGLTLLYIFAAEQIGFLPIAFLMLLVLFVWFRVRFVVALPTAAATVWVVHWFFSSLMRVPLPRGLLTNIL